MVMVTTLQVFYTCNYNSQYAFNARKLFDYLFMTAPDGSIKGVGEEIYIYSTTTLQQFVNNTVQNYYALDSNEQLDYIY
jgi:hypothetical protein